ncbi:MAG: hypothetical protein KAS32_10655 [Candidatus Peribacteraceae bacterium]|nr:hypothetical protein [Candidatus Peribacteraceae bacterium]
MLKIKYVDEIPSNPPRRNSQGYRCITTGAYFVNMNTIYVMKLSLWHDFKVLLHELLHYLANFMPTTVTEKLDNWIDVHLTVATPDNFFEKIWDRFINKEPK